MIERLLPKTVLLISRYPSSEMLLMSLSSSVSSIFPRSSISKSVIAPEVRHRYVCLPLVLLEDSCVEEVDAFCADAGAKPASTMKDNIHAVIFPVDIFQKL